MKRKRGKHLKGRGEGFQGTKQPHIWKATELYF